jgi:5-methylcytosine-specific restriction enzyme B
VARFDPERLAPTYEAASRIVDRGLRHDDSLFTSGQPIWSLANFEELDRLYVQAYDPGEGTFEEKLYQQIGDGAAMASANAAAILGTFVPDPILTGSMVVGGGAMRRALTRNRE